MCWKTVHAFFYLTIMGHVLAGIHLSFLSVRYLDSDIPKPWRGGSGCDDCGGTCTDNLCGKDCRRHWMAVKITDETLAHLGPDKMAAIFQTTFSNATNISPRFVCSNDIPALVQIMACRRPLPEPIVVSLLAHICVTRPQWLKCNFVRENKYLCSS